MIERNTWDGKCAGFSGNPPPSGSGVDVGEAVAELEAGAYLMMVAPTESSGGGGRNPNQVDEMLISNSYTCYLGNL